MAHVDRLHCALTGAPGTTGAFAIGAALPGFVTFPPAANGLSYSVLVIEGTAWEVRTGCVYTHAGTSLSRGTLRTSSTGSAIAFTEAATLMNTIVAAEADSFLLIAPAVAEMVVDVATTMVYIVEGGVQKAITIEDFVASVSEPVGSLPLAGPLSLTDIITLSQDAGQSQVQTTLADLLEFFGGSVEPGPELLVNTPSAQTAGTPFAVTGGYAGYVPTQLDYSVDGGVNWVQAVGPTIASGNFSLQATVTTANASQVIRVRDRTQTTVFADSAPFVVAAGGGTGDVYNVAITGPESSWPANRAVGAEGYTPSNIGIYIKRKDNNLAPAPDGAIARFAWSTSSTVKPTQYWITASRLGWNDASPVGEGYYGLHSSGGTLYAWGPAGTYYLWIEMSDGSAWTVKDDGGINPRGWVLS